MLRKLAAVLILIGLCTPDSCGVRPVSHLWEPDLEGFVLQGLPVLAGIAYVLYALWSWLKRASEKRAAGLQKILLGAFIVPLVLSFVGWSMDASETWQAWLIYLAMWAALIGLLTWALRRGEPARRLPLLFLGILGIFVVPNSLPAFSRLDYGGWILNAGYTLALLTEVRLLARPPDSQRRVPTATAVPSPPGAT